MPKRHLQKEIINELESSDDEFYLDSYDHEEINSCGNSDSDSFEEEEEEEGIDISTDSDIVVDKKRRTMPLPTSSSSSEDEYTTERSDNYGPWLDVTLQDSVPYRINFTSGDKTEGPQIPDNCTKPTDFFKLFFSDELIEKIVEETNNYARNKIAKKILSKRSTWHTWVDVTVEEITAFLGVILNMGTITVSNLQEYWSRNFNSKIPFFGSIFRRERFMQIYWMLHLNKNNPNDQRLRARTQKVSHYLELLDKKFKEHFIPSREISVDESVVGFKGKICFLTYNPKKPTKWGIRIYVLADANTGYVYSILPYYGSLTSEDLPRPDLLISTRIVLKLCQDLLDSNPGSKGYHIYTDRYYTSLPLAQELLKLNIHTTGTIQNNRKFIPDSIKKPKFSQNNTFACRSENLLLLAWKDKRVVTILSSWDVSGTQPINRRVRGGNIQVIDKPTVIVNYNKYMGGVDRADSYSASYCFLRKSLKWWRKLFFWGLELCSVNAYLLYKITQHRQNKRPMTHLKFVRELVDGLTANYRQRSKIPGRPSMSDKEERLNGKLHILRQNEGKKKDCLVCSNRKVKGGRHETRYICNTCTLKPGLHIGECFERYHTMQNYKI